MPAFRNYIKAVILQTVKPAFSERKCMQCKCVHYWVARVRLMQQSIGGCTPPHHLSHPIPPGPTPISGHQSSTCTFTICNICLEIKQTKPTILAFLAFVWLEVSKVSYLSRTTYVKKIKRGVEKFKIEEENIRWENCKFWWQKFTDMRC